MATDVLTLSLHQWMCEPVISEVVFDVDMQ